MKATLMSRDKLTARIILTPCLIARMFGARALMVTIVKNSGVWRTEGNDIHIDCCPYGDKIKTALDFVPVEPLPRAEVRR